jgi:hypothetical protein
MIQNIYFLLDIRHDDKLKLSIYLFAYTQADVLSRFHFLANVNTNLCEQWTCEFSGSRFQGCRKIYELAL